MSNRWLRFVIAFLAIGAAGAAGYRILQHEQRLVADMAATRAAEQVAESALATIPEIKAALHAYVATGQGNAFWTARAAMLLEKLRGSILELDPAASGVGAPLTEALDLSDRLSASEQRARDHVRQGQALLAGEVIFTDARDSLDGIRLQIVRARDRIAQTAGALYAEIRREQTLLALAAAGVLAFAVLLLVIPGRADRLAESEARSAPEPSSIAAAPLPSSEAQPPAPQVSKAPLTPRPLSEAAALCTDFGRASESAEIDALLKRAATVLTASGIVVWMASDKRDELFPVSSTGYNERVFARIGPIQRTSANLTAAAFREGAARTSPRLGASAAALAVPLLTPHGSVGVFSAELRDNAEIDADCLALATIFAAQLSTLLGSLEVPTESTVVVQQAQV